MSNSRFTKIYDKERELLFKTNSVTAYEVYFHLKGDNSYFKKEFMDLRRCIASYLNIPERTVKDALQRLIKVGLIKTNKRGKVNYYTLPYDTDIKENRKEDERKPDVQTEQTIITPTYEDIEKSIEETTVSEVKTPSVPIKEEKKEDEQPIIQEKKEDEFQKDVEVAVNELAQIALYGKGKKMFYETLTKHSNSLSIRYNLLYDDVEEQLRNMSKEKYLKFKGLKEVG